MDDTATQSNLRAFINLNAEEFVAKKEIIQAIAVATGATWSDKYGVSNGN